MYEHTTPEQHRARMIAADANTRDKRNQAATLARMVQRGQRAEAHHVASMREGLALDPTLAGLVIRAGIDI